MSYTRFYLKNPRKEPESYIRGRVKLFPGQYYEFYLSGEKIAKKHWKAKAGRARNTYTDHTGMNDYLDKVSIYFNNVRRKLLLSGKLTNSEMEKAEKQFFGKITHNIFDVFDEQIERIEKSPRYSKTMARKYKNVRDKLEEFKPKMTFDSITESFVEDWVDFLYTNHELSPNTVRRYFGFLSTFLTICSKRGYNNNFHYRDISIGNIVKGTKNIYPYLSIAELDQIYEKKVSGALHNTKLNLLKGCYSALRYSDWARLNLDTLTKIGDREYFVLGNQKTKSIVHIPAFEKLKVLINQDSHPISNQKFNVQVKDLCEVAGIKQTFTKFSFKSNKMEELRLPKYKVVSSHIGRRSFACNSILAGVPKRIIMNVGGWKSEDSFEKYIQLSSLDGMNHFDNVF